MSLHRVIRFSSEDITLAADLDHSSSLSLFWSELAALIRATGDIPEGGLLFHVHLTEEGPAVGVLAEAKA